MLHAQSTGRTPAHPAPVLYACCACWDIPLCTLTNHRPVLTPFSQSTSSPHHCMQLHANVHAHTCGHWTHASSPSAHQIPPNPRAPESQVPAAQSHTISSQGLHEVHSCSCTRMTRELTTEHPHQVPSAWHLVTGNSLPPEMAVRTVSCTREDGGCGPYSEEWCLAHTGRLWEQLAVKGPEMLRWPAHRDPRAPLEAETATLRDPERLLGGDLWQVACSTRSARLPSSSIRSKDHRLLVPLFPLSATWGEWNRTQAGLHSPGEAHGKSKQRLWTWKMMGWGGPAPLVPRGLS